MGDTTKYPGGVQPEQQIPIPAQVYIPSYTTTQYQTFQQPPVVYNIPASSVPQYPAVQPVAQHEGWFIRNSKNKPQSNSAGAASLLFISGGMNMAWGLGLSVSLNILASDQLLTSWFIGGIIGAVVGAFACNHMPKKFIIIFASILVIICGILQTSDPDSYDAILASRYLNGIGVGLAFPMTFVLIGEEVVPIARGMIAASIDTMCFSCGIFIQIIFAIIWTSSDSGSFESMQVCGILNIIYGAIALIMGSMLVIESPILYLARGDEQSAIDALRRLQRPFTITHETYQQLEEHKRYLAQSKEKSFIENALYGIPALLKLCFYRSFMALGFSYFVNFTFTYASTVSSKLEVYPFILYALARWLGHLFVSVSIDSKGRKTSMLSSFFFSTILALAVGGICNNDNNLINFDYMNAVKYILIFFQLFSGMSMVSSSAYLSEAFPLVVKPYYIAIVFIVEMLIHIIVICCRDNYLSIIANSSDYFITMGVLSLIFLCVSPAVLPETKLLTLRECLPRMRSSNNFRN